MFVSVLRQWIVSSRQSLYMVRGSYFRNGLRISVLDQDLSQAQLAQLEEFLDFDVDEDLF